METFKIPRRKVARYFGIAQPTLHRWLHKIEDQTPSGTPANKTPTEVASLVWEITKANRSCGRIRIANNSNWAHPVFAYFRISWGSAPKPR